jgi:hypothetical protein
MQSILFDAGFNGIRLFFWRSQAKTGAKSGRIQLL